MSRRRASRSKSLRVTDQAAGIPLGTVLADVGYGYDSQFRDGVTELGWPMTPAIHPKTRYCVKLDGSEKHLMESGLTLDINRLLRHRNILSGKHVAGTLTWNNTRYENRGADRLHWLLRHD